MLQFYKLVSRYHKILLLREMATEAKIIGFAGVTNGGKTTICRQLQESLQEQGVEVTHYNMDDYYWEEDSKNHVPLPEFDNKYANWDDVCAVDWNRLNRDITVWNEQTASRREGSPRQALLVEGIMIYNNRDLVKNFDKKYFFTLPKDECWERRRKRSYLPPEPEGYFEKIAWPYYMKLKQEVDSLVDIEYIDGTREQNNILKEVQSQIKELIFDKCVE